MGRAALKELYDDVVRLDSTARVGVLNRDPEYSRSYIIHIYIIP